MEGLFYSYPLARNLVAWKISNGRSLKVGHDPWARSGKSYKLSKNLISQLLNKIICTLAGDNLQHPQSHKGTVWKTSQELGLSKSSVVEWSCHINKLGSCFIYLNE